MVTSFVQSHLVLAFVLILPTVAPAFTYQIDDGIAERFAAPPRGRTLAWLNSFQVLPGAETITSVELTLFDDEVYPVTVLLWNDPTNDGNPIDAQVIREVSVLTGTTGFVNVPMTPVNLSEGSWFFAGALYTQPKDAPFVYYPASIDLTDPDFSGRSYDSLWFEGIVADPNHLAAGAFSHGPETDGNYLIRVHAVPEPTALVLALAGAIGFGALSSRRHNGSPWAHSQQLVSRRPRAQPIQRR